MSGRQRFTFLAIAVVIAIVAVIVLADSSEDETEPAQTAATATATATAEEPAAEDTPTPTPTPEPPPLLTAGKVTELEATEGETVRFRVRSDTPEEVHVHGYNISKAIEAGQTATMSFKAAITGIFEIEFEESGTQIAELKVEPG
jgi:FtsP/CotA-like multicopper oxidase with cupredoxin domain